jgi:hypothetical protein
LPVSHDLDAPADDEELYLAVGDDVDDLRPVNQGDVYEGIALPGFEAGHHDLVMLATHPCSLRKGAALKPRLQAAPVTRAKSITAHEWATDHKRSMPLPQLRDGKFYAATLTEVSIVTPAQLAAASRIATLSDKGVQLLNQRLIWAMTHTVVGLDTVAEFAAPALAELELLEEWNMRLCGDQASERADKLGRLAVEFEDFIRASGVQAALEQEQTRADARRRAREELQRRIAAEQ